MDLVRMKYISKWRPIGPKNQGCLSKNRNRNKTTEVTPSGTRFVN